MAYSLQRSISMREQRNPVHADLEVELDAKETIMLTKKDLNNFRKWLEEIALTESLSPRDRSLAEEYAAMLRSYLDSKST